MGLEEDMGEDQEEAEGLKVDMAVVQEVGPVEDM